MATTWTAEMARRIYGFITPTDSDLRRNGDDAITNNAIVTAQLIARAQAFQGDPENIRFAVNAETLPAGSSASGAVVGEWPAYTLNLSLPRGNPGTNGKDGNPTAYEMRGAGRPSAAPPAGAGTYYTDTTGADGAWRWLWTGAKWVPAAPATTRYDLTPADFRAPFVPAAASSTINLFRDGNTVTMAAEFKANAATSGATIVAQLPAGYRPSKYQWLTSTVPTGYTLTVNTGGVLVCNTSAASGTVIRAGGISWTTADDWSTT